MTYSETPDIVSFPTRFRKELLTPAQLETLKGGTLRLLDEVGVHVPSRRALDILADHGARVDPIVDDPDLPQSEYIDRGGANNLICPEKTLSSNCNGQVASAFLVEFKKVDIMALKEKYPESFARDYDPASGLRFSGWVEGGEL